MPFTSFVPSGTADFTASGTGDGNPNRLAVGDLATVHVSDPELSDLSGVTITYHWWVGSTELTSETGDSLFIAAQYMGQDVHVTVSFTHTEATANGHITEHELGVLDFGAVNTPPSGSLHGVVTVTAEDGLNVVSGHLDIHDPDVNDHAHVGGVSLSTTAVSSTFDGQFGELHLTKDGNFHYTADLANPTLMALGAGEFRIEHIHYTLTDGVVPVQGEFVIKIEGAHASSASGTLHDDSAAVADLAAYNTFSTTNLVGNVLANDSATGSLHVTNVVFGDVSHTISGSGQTTIGGAYGTLHMHGNGDYSFDVNETAVNALAAGFHTTLDFAIAVSNGESTDFEHLTIQVDGANDTFVTATGTLSGTVGTHTAEGYQYTYTSGWMGFDPENSALDFSLSGHHVSVSGQPSGEYTYLTDVTAFGTFWLWNTGYWSFALDASSTAYLAIGASDSTDLHFHVGFSDAGGAGGLADVVIHVYGDNDDPTAVSDTILVPSVTCGAYHLTGNLLDNDTDPDRYDQLAVVSVWASGSSGSSAFADFQANVLTESGPVTVLQNHNAYGTFTVWSDGHYTLDIDPNDPDYIALAPGETAQLFFSYEISDGHSDTSWAELTIVVSGIDEPPVGYDSTVMFTEDPETAVTSGTLSFTSPDSGPLQVLGIAAPTPSGSFTWDTTPLTVEFDQYTVSNTYGKLEVSGDFFRFTLDNSSPAVQALAAGETHIEQFQYMVSDGYGGTDIASINVVIHGINDAPVAASTSVTGYDSGTISGSYYSGSSVSVDLLCLATDIDHSDTLTVVGIATSTDSVYSSSLSTSLGSATVDGSGILHFHIDEAAVNHLAAGASEQVTIAYKVMDIHGSTDLNTVTITIAGANDAPNVTCASVSMTEDMSSVGGNLLSGAYDPDDGDQPHVALVNGLPSLTHIAGNHGWMSVTASGDYQYHLSVSAVQSLTALQSTFDTFTFTASDGHGGTDMAQLQVTIHGLDDAPVVSMDSAAVCEAANTTLASTTTGNVLFNDSVSGVSQSLSAVSLDGVAITADTLTATGLYGQLRLSIDGYYTYSLDNANGAVDALNVGDVLHDTFHYKASDGHGNWGTADIQVTINGVNDAPVAASKMGGSAFEAGVGFAGMDATGNLLSVISDVDDTNAQLAIASVSGVVLEGSTQVVTGEYGTLHVTAHGHYSYDLDDLNITVDALQTGESLADCFEYRVQDSHGAWVTNTIDISIAGRNDAPIVSDVAVSAAESGTATEGMSASGCLLASSHASDVDGDVLVVTGVNGATSNVSTDVAGEFGSLSVTASGSFHYHVNEGAADFLDLGQSATDVFSVRVADGHGGWDLANIVVTVHGANDAPAAGADSGTAGEVGSTTAGFDATGTVLTNDTDPDKNAILLVSKVNGNSGGVGTGVAGSYGTLILYSDGSYHYVIDNTKSAVNALGPADTLHDIFTYTVSDGFGGTSTAQLDITIQGANDKPSGAVSISGTAATGDTLTAISTLVDPEGIGTLHYQWQSDGHDIAGANGSSFVMTAAQMNTIVGVVVTYTDGGGTDEAVTATIAAVPGQYIPGTPGNDSLFGFGGNDTIDGGRGRDTMSGGAGNDLYYVNDAHDVVLEGANAGHDTVISSVNYILGANVEDLTLTGSATLAKGNDLDNVIVGNARNDSITGYGGADTLSGGAGQDTFVYTSVGDSCGPAYDVILDFNAGQRDKIDLRQIDARDNVPYNQNFRWIGSAEFDPEGNNAGLLRFDPVTHMLEGSTNADANAEFRILLVGVDHIGNNAGGISMANILL